MLRRAGNERNEPPPATAFNMPARKVAITNQTQCQLTVTATPERCMKRIVLHWAGCAGSLDTKSW